MALSIKDKETDELVRELAARRNLSMTQAIKLAVSNELKRSNSVNDAVRRARIDAIRKIQRRTLLRPELMTAEQVEAELNEMFGFE